MSAVLDDIGTRLTSQGVVGGATGWTLAKSYLPASPDQVVCLFDTLGEEPDESEGTAYDKPGFQVQVRGSKLGYEAARAKAQEVFAALDNATVASYIYIYAVSSQPLPLGYDENERPILSWNFRTMRERLV